MTDDSRPRQRRGLALVSLERRREIARMGRAKSHSGFEHMTPERRREVARKGTQTAHARGVTHRWTPEEAAAAGRTGGRISRPYTRKKRKEEAS
jgi:general stress protein YciG